MDDVIRWLQSAGKELIPLTIALFLVVIGLAGARRLLDRASQGGSDRRFRNQLVMAGLSLVGLIAVVLNLPIEEQTKSQLLSLLGLVLSAGIALSSTTFLGNAMAGLMLRAVRNFRTGDFIHVDEHFGRVSVRGLFHTEIQTEERDLTTLPNLYLVTNPVRVIRSTGTIVSAAVSLGYDVPREKIEAALVRGAKEIGLEEPFVQVRELGDFSVTYRTAGLLTDVKHLVSMRSALRKASMAALHADGIEIVSPTFMNTRALSPADDIIPEASPTTSDPLKGNAPDEVIFDKADEAERLETRQKRLDALAEELKRAKAALDAATDDTERARLTRQVERYEARERALQREIEARRDLMTNLDDDSTPK